MPDRDPGFRMTQTDFGWALEGDTPPRRGDLLWVHRPTGDIYHWDGDGWFRMKPADNKQWKND